MNVDEIIEKAIESDEPISAVDVAMKVFAEADDLVPWLKARALPLITGHVNHILRASKRAAKKRIARETFGDAVEEFLAARESGQDEPARAFERRRVELMDARYRDNEGNSRPLRNMTVVDLRAESQRYFKSSRSDLFESVFLEACARRVTKANAVTLGETMSNEQVENMRREMLAKHEGHDGAMKSSTPPQAA